MRAPLILLVVLAIVSASFALRGALFRAGRSVSVPIELQAQVKRLIAPNLEMEQWKKFPEYGMECSPAAYTNARILSPKMFSRREEGTRYNTQNNFLLILTAGIYRDDHLLILAVLLRSTGMRCTAIQNIVIVVVTIIAFLNTLGNAFKAVAPGNDIDVHTLEPRTDDGANTDVPDTDGSVNTYAPDNKIADRLAQYESRLREILEELRRLEKEANLDSSRTGLLAQIECELKIYEEEFRRLRIHPSQGTNVARRMVNILRLIKEIQEELLLLQDKLKQDTNVAQRIVNMEELLRLQDKLKQDTNVAQRIVNMVRLIKEIQEELLRLQDKLEQDSNITDRLAQYERRFKEILEELRRLEKEAKLDSSRTRLLAQIECELKIYAEEFRRLQEQPNQGTPMPLRGACDGCELISLGRHVLLQSWSSGHLQYEQC
ncbi:hypothetical protein Q1695_015338 [Nippostrongylus brasiliensis]|nr:hypothetical protein Q1695_015338 [Nippostrongylus brasiliensis]